jgi:hypothetical protein
VTTKINQRHKNTDHKEIHRNIKDGYACVLELWMVLFLFFLSFNLYYLCNNVIDSMAPLPEKVQTDVGQI